MPEFSLPENVREVLSRLSVADQVVIRSYIAGLRDQLKEYKALAGHPEGDAHAHYHGHELCTADHGHHHGHAEAKDEGACEEHSCDGGHDHAHHHDHKKESDSHEHHEHAHAHHHDHKKEDEDNDMPAWKKQALESGADAMAAPFGGSWNTESSLDATK
ncbi:hypothetical protein HJC23_008241 [Cyclotella cryptica]|uniref:Uncharacterized protein n=1 Tax=Cyclotella cryptica TaxID=29204 RepID=A0ABD3Q701_9STRA|eukprot:CCRYP_008379-RB/>CCRYP_008379-RB protein AED:0.18 eAED:0.18 QI:502/1/1/1/0.83/0.71/7/267/158